MPDQRAAALNLEHATKQAVEAGVDVAAKRLPDGREIAEWAQDEHGHHVAIPRHDGKLKDGKAVINGPALVTATQLIPLRKRVHELETALTGAVTLLRETTAALDQLGAAHDATRAREYLAILDGQA